VEADGGSKPFLRHGNNMTREVSECCVKAITILILKGWIRPSSCAWGAPVLFVRKPNGDMRLVCDYRMLNNQCEIDGLKISLIDVLVAPDGQ
jgi:hypothetical protein